MATDAVTWFAYGTYAVTGFKVSKDSVMGYSVLTDAHFLLNTFTWYLIVLWFIHGRIFYTL